MALGTSDAPGPGTERTSKKAHVFRVWSKFDSHFMKPLLTHSRPCLVETLPHWLYYVARFLTSDEQLYATINGRSPHIPTDAVKFSDLVDEGGFQEPASDAVIGGGGAANGSSSGSGSEMRLRLSALHMNFGSLDLNEAGTFSPSGSRPAGAAATGDSSSLQVRREPSADSQLMDVTLDAPGAASSAASTSASAAADSGTKPPAQNTGSTRIVGLDDDPKV